MAFNRTANKIITYCIASIWLVNGLICKVLNFVPRHEQIVSRIMGSSFSKPLTVTIGTLEVGMAIWIITGFKSRLNAIAQILIITVMNLIEFFLCSDLLLWGKLNIVFAFVLIIVIYLSEYHLNQQTGFQN